MFVLYVFSSAIVKLLHPLLHSIRYFRQSPALVDCWPNKGDYWLFWIFVHLLNWHYDGDHCKVTTTMNWNCWVIIVVGSTVTILVVICTLTITKALTFNYLIMILQWSPSLCRERRHTRNPLVAFTLHGIWLAVD